MFRGKFRPTASLSTARRRPGSPKKTKLIPINYKVPWNTGTLTATERITAGCAAGLGHQRGRYAELRGGDLLPSASSTISVPDGGVSDLPSAVPVGETIIATGDNADPLSQTFSDTVFAIEKPFVPTTTTLDISWSSGPTASVDGSDTDLVRRRTRNLFLSNYSSNRAR